MTRKSVKVSSNKQTGLLNMFKIDIKQKKLTIEAVAHRCSSE